MRMSKMRRAVRCDAVTDGTMTDTRIQTRRRRVEVTCTPAEAEGKMDTAMLWCKSHVDQTPVRDEC